ncbi:MAG: hypothetical protein KDI28_03845 [Pseudomonadales bacterium]|nr:hypothetical protein [Pseudomonadales bacterium]MCP5357998.1 hypothetical protein [Pseudomonadales bacterium]
MRSQTLGFTRLILTCLLVLGSARGFAQTSHSHWSGVWQVEGSPFTVRVTSHDNLLHVEPVESMGFIWRNTPGRISGNNATFEVEYQGVTATVLVQKADEDTAIARPLSCQPDYHIVCALVQNQQALFVKLHTPQ